MGFNRGIVISQSPTPLLAPVQVNSALGVAVGVAPVHRLEDPAAAVNKPFLLFSFGEFQQRLGYTDNNWFIDGKPCFNLAQVAFSQFRLHLVSPLVCINVWNPLPTAQDVAVPTLPIINGVATIDDPFVMISGVTVHGSGDAYVRDVDYTLRYDGDNLLITVIQGGGIPAATNSLSVTYKQADPTTVTRANIVGGVEPGTNRRTGISLIDQVFLDFGLIPGFILSPGWSTDPEIGALLSAKASALNDSDFSCVALLDMPCDGEFADFTKIPQWKNDNGYNSRYAYGDWPCVSLGDRVFNASTRLLGLHGQVDAGNGGIPFEHASNRNLQMTGICQSDGTPIPMLTRGQANFLNGQGIGTFLNYGGNSAWGGETLAFPNNTDIKDFERTIVRMFSFVQNTVNLTMRQMVDRPIKRRNIDRILLTGNEYLNMLVARQAIIGGRVEFLRSDNPNINLISGQTYFRVYLTPSPGAREIEFNFAFDPDYFERLF